MPVWDEMGSFFKTMRVYLLGRGLLSLAVMVAGFASPAIMSVLGITGMVMAPALVVAIGGAALSAVMRLHSQAIYEDKMTDLYREDIAGNLHIAPQDVTRDHLMQAAMDNEVIAQALARQRRLNVISFATTALAALATFGLLNFALAQNIVGDALTGFFSDYFGKAANLLRYAGIGIVSGTSSLILHRGLEEAIGKGSGLDKAVAHDLIFAMDKDVRRGRSITPQQVYAVLVAKDDGLSQAIAARFNEPFQRMNEKEQCQVLTALGVTDGMEHVAAMISSGELPAGHLAYVIEDASMIRRPVPIAVPEKVAVRGQFVERLGLAARPAQSHAERLATARETSAAYGQELA